MSGTETKPDADPATQLLGGQAATDAQMDEILRELEPPKADERDEAPEPRREAPKQEAAPEVEASEPEPKEEKKEPEDPAFERAVAALRRDGYSGEDIHSLPKSRVIALGEKAAKRQQDVQAKLTDRSKDIQRIKELEKTLAEKRSAEPATPPIEDTLLSDLKPFDDEFGAELGSKLAKVMAGREKAIRDELATLKEEREQFKSDLVALRLETARGRLGERFPGLLEEATWNQAVDKLLKIWPGADYPSFEEGLLDVAMFMRLDSQSDSEAKETQRKSRGQPTGNGRKARPAAAMSPDEQEYQMLLQIERDQGYAG